MKPLKFTEKDLVSFGNYLLSVERTMLVFSNPETSDEHKQESLMQVSDSDVQNWLEVFLMKLL